MASTSASCLICSSKDTKVSRLGQSSSVSERVGGAVSSHSEVILILRKLLNLPSQLCQSFLIQHGNPTDWGVLLCRNCKEQFLDRITTTIELISELEGQITLIQEEATVKVISTITESTTAAISGPKSKPKPRGKRKNKTGFNPVVEKVHKWIMDNSMEKSQPSIKKTAAEIDKEVGINAQKAETEKAFRTLGMGQKCGNSSTSVAGSSSRLLEGISINTGATVSNTPKGQEPYLPNCASSVVTTEQFDAKKAAAAAALARLGSQKPVLADEKQRLANRQAAFIKEQARKELAMESEHKEVGTTNNNVEVNGEEPKACCSSVASNSVSVIIDPPTPKIIDPASYIVNGVYFKCPLIGPGVFSKKEADEKIQEFLLKELKKEDRGETACLLIRSCNRPEKVTSCVEILTAYLDNIIKHPKEEKYKQIRCMNRAYKERVACVLGADQFLLAAGFEKTFVAVPGWDDQQEEEVWQYSYSEEDIPDLIELRDLLKTTLPMKPEIDRNVQVIESCNLNQRLEIPDEFYNLTRDEIKREQILKTEKVELESTLRTKAMRDRDQAQEQRIYRYGVIRVRFPDALVIQGTFEATETLKDVYEFVRESLLLEDLSFNLIKAGGENLNSSDQSQPLSSMGLIPTSVLNFQAIDPPALLSTGEMSFLKPEIIQLVP